MSVSRDHYFKLGSEVNEERIEAVVQLIKELSSVDTQEEYEYALNRLVKGLSTSRQSARYGFSMALTELIPQMVANSSLSIELYLEMVHRVIDLKSKKGKDERSALFGKLFALQALVNLKVVLNTNQEHCEILVHEFLTLAMVKSWLRETVIYSMLQFINQLPSKSIYAYVIKTVNELGISVSNEGLAIYLEMDLAGISGPELEGWKGPPLSKGNGILLGKVLKEVEVDSDLKQKGAWNPRLHFVWDLLLRWFDRSTVEHTPKSKKRKLNSEPLGLKEFWKSIIDEGFFSDKASHERKYLGLEIFAKFFALPESLVAYIITPNLVRCIINQASQNDRILNKQAHKVLDVVKQECYQHRNKTAVTVKHLVDNGGWNFDLLTKTKTVDQLLSVPQTDVANVENIRDVLLAHINVFVDLPQKRDNNIKWALNGLVTLIRCNKPLLSQTNWIVLILQLILKYALFSTPLKEFTSLFKDKLSAILSEIIKYKHNETSWPAYCIDYIHELETSNDLVDSLDQELATIKNDCNKTLTEILSLPTSNHRFNFELLFSMVLLQMYNGDEDAFELVDELNVCYSKADSDQSLVILTEIVLSFVSKKSNLWRKFSLLIWENLLCKEIGEEGLQLLFNVLVTKENREGKESLFDGEPEIIDNGSQEEGGSDSDTDSDSPSSSESEAESESGPESDSESEINQQTNIKLAQALGMPVHTGEVNINDMSSGDSSYESESMDDEQMMAMDDHLSKIFKERRNILSLAESGNKRKAEAVEAREQMVFFKNRILDLLEIFIKHNENSHLNFLMIKPLLTLINLTLDKQVGTKAHKLIKARLSKVKLDSSDKLQIPYLIQLLKWVHQYNHKTKSNVSFTLGCQQISILIAKNLIILDPQLLDQLINIYNESMLLWAKNPKSNIQPGLFFDFINWLNSKRTPIKS